MVIPKARSRRTAAARAVTAAAIALFATAYSLAAPQPPALGAMANATYLGILDDPVTLRDGTWEGSPYAPGGASRPRVTLVPGFRVVGDLDGDGAPEAVVLLAASLGGSGTFNHLAAVGRDGTGIAVRAVAPLGDRVQVRYARIETGRLVIDTVEAGEDDAACCPGEKRRRSWKLAGGSLDEQPAESLGRLGVEDLGGGITWRLTHLDRGRRVVVEGAPWLTYEDGKLTGFTGCNRFFGAVEATDGPGEVRIGPLGITRKACPGPAMELEREFTKRLEAVGKFGFLGSQLALTWRDDVLVGTLLFVAE